MIKNKTIALIAHDRRKKDMVEWVEHNAEVLIENDLVCTGTTGKLVEMALSTFTGDGDNTQKINIKKMNSGPMGGDAEIAALVVQGKIDFCVFLIDDLNANPHEADIQMLLRQCRVHNIPVACNRSTADYILTSNLWGEKYEPTKPQYAEYTRY